ncbi:MAG: efflux RND transporter periplasmic adaptor subunit [Cyanobacteria bacterium J06614_10]
MLKVGGAEATEQAASNRPTFKLSFGRGPRWLLLLLPLAAVPVFALNQTNRDQPARVSEAVLPVEVTRLSAADSYTVSREYTGEIVARRSSELGFERAGTVMSLQVDEGDFVSEGAVLATLDTRDLIAQRQQLQAQKRQSLAQLEELEVGPRSEDVLAAQAAVSDLRNQLELAQLQAQRRASLYAQGAVSKEELDERQFGANAIADRLQQAQSQLTELQNGTRQEQISAQVARVEQIDAQIQAVDISLDKSRLLAPFSGKIASRLVDEGTVVASGQQVMKLVESDRLEARIGVPDAIAPRLQTGSQQRITVGDRTYSAQVTSQLPEVDEPSQTVTLVLEIINSDETEPLTIGATARLAIAEQQPEEGYWLPSTALVAGEQGLWSAYVVTAETDLEETDYRVARRDVEVLHTEGSRAFIRGLVQAGDRVITSGTHRIVTGQKVNPTDSL